ncbi:MAG: branched-chain amino acid ABC transporter permease [Desulfurococcales archaeon]|nr:branched-chain amino acid ABC transporter permease [Desulfurococcales archaeon]
MDLNVFTTTTIYASVLALLSLGITLIYMTTRVFNFAHPRLSLVAAYAAATFMAIYARSAHLKPNLEPAETSIGYVTVPFPASFYLVGVVAATVFGVVAALVEYYAILKPLLRRGADYLKLMIATLAYDFILMAVLFLYNTHRAVKSALSNPLRLTPTSLSMTAYDVSIVTEGGTFIAGMFIFSAALAVALAAALYLLLYRTTLGVKMRASIENPPLAEVLGINVERIYAIAWILSGATAGLAGYIMLFATSAGSLKPISATSPADEIVVSAFAGSIVGGVNSIFGSIAGGLLIGYAETYVTQLLQAITGYPEMFQYARVVSMAIVALTLLFAPSGLAGLLRSPRARRLLSRIPVPGRARGGGR